MYHNGYSITGSVAGGAITGGMTYAGGKIGDNILSFNAKKKKQLSHKALKMRGESPQLSKQYTNNIRSRLIDLGLKTEELAIKNTDDLGINKSDEIMKLTDQYIDSLQLKSPQFEKYLRNKMYDGGRELGEYFRHKSMADYELMRKLGGGSITTHALTKAKSKMESDIAKELMSESILEDKIEFNNTLDKIMDSASQLFDDIAKGVV